MRELLGYINGLAGVMILLGIISNVTAAPAVAMTLTPMGMFVVTCLMFMFAANTVALLWED